MKSAESMKLRSVEDRCQRRSVGLKAETAKCRNGVKAEPIRLDRTAGVQIGDF